MSSTPEQPTSKPVILFSSGATSYELLRYLGASSNGEVLLARRRYADTLGSSVLIKRLQEPSSGVERARLLDEFKLILQLSHPCIAQAYLVRMHEGSPHVVMEHVDGYSLESLLSFAAMRGQPMPEPFAAYLVGEVADALQYAHTLRDARGRPLGIVHRDVSPRNIRFGFHGRVKLTDFASAYSKMEGRMETVGPLLKGDIAYSSPEYLMLQPLDARSDLFSLGVVLLELVTGKHLLDLEEVQQAMRMAGPPTTVQASLQSELQSWATAPEMSMRMERFRPEHVERATRGLSAPMRAIVLKALRRDPGERFQSGQELRDELWAFMGGTGRCYGPQDAEREAARVRSDATRRHGGAQLPESEEFSPRPPGLVPRRHDP
ncbi:serine/threonine-protein kinase [Hyalangium rubrum]|uniref:Serine/threonine-protein kinase n=1 Tax=Hyalangium rubrum TaxID=3103134 RepID=A0ABU5HD09_9BACT|nr:serine/threonine-protein kinase [Hyalangium sp. s54d21]MDY7230712.1 serine/threonine-protein kinase [Hyalangium sp. s54d21]